MIFHIDTRRLKDYNISFSSLLILLSVYFNDPLRVDNIPEDIQYHLKYSDSNRSYYLTQKGVDEIEEIFLKSEFTDKKENKNLEKLALELREIFPKGKKPGTAYMWKDSPNMITKRLQAFIKKFGEYPYETIIKATRKYVESFNGNYTYMQLLKYFIFKDDESQLLSYISNIEDIQEDYGSQWDELR